MENRREDEGRMPQYREGQPERAYGQWENETETENMNRGRWEGGGWEGRREGGMDSGREQGQGRDRSNVTRFGQRREGQSSSSQGMSGRQSFAGRGPQGYKRSDERITEDINEELTQDHELDASDVSVEVKDGEVTLKGSVPDRESKRRAEDLAESCSGVKDVLNQLRIKREGSSESEHTSQRDKSEDKRNKVAS
jgi:osmotically-inducible protein OsmY